MTPGTTVDTPTVLADDAAEPDPVLELAATLERALTWLRRATDTGGLSTVALATLGILDAAGPLRLTELVARERITQPGMTGVVTRLVDAGFVTREADPTDGRAALVVITPAGRRRVAELHAERAGTIAAQLRRLEPADRGALHAAAAALSALSALPPLVGND